MRLLSDRTLLDFGIVLSTAVLIAVTIKSAYLSRSLLDVRPEKHAEPSAASRVDSNTSLSVWSNLYLVCLIDEFLPGGTSVQISMGRWSLPKSWPIWNWMSCRRWGSNSQPLDYKPIALAIELYSSKAIAGKELSLSSWCISSLYIYHFSTVIDFSSEKYSGSTGHRNSWYQ